VAVKTGLRDTKSVEVLQYQRSSDGKTKQEAWADMNGDMEFVRDLVAGMSNGQEVRLRPKE
jgi:hypothetical protein